ncbi:bifunctional 3-deoxy-7-phosphoheptulonate synthase/chorismate mutase type II [Desulfoferrobacter suflitae]|uniref:bifunctional 3-deoxy-7-phosphoheptulonate synthase/chorismate mutase type II n=1 Tax=Desulfoferrobacter suflitae TaxID=2865782 RepID=UPI00338E7F0A
MELNIRELSQWGIPYSDVFVISGPCSAESRKQMIDTACAIAKYPVSALRGGIWKPRTRPGSFEGVGAEGLAWLREAGDRAGLPVTTEVAKPSHVEKCLRQGIDILWIGARTTTNPFAVQEIADALRGVDIPVLVKNPISPDLGLWIGAIERVNQAGITRIAAIHRGFCSFNEKVYRNTPEWRIPIELRRKIPKLPMICDPSHICGTVELLSGIIRKAMDLLFDGLMIECHINPRAALSDAQQQVTPRELGVLLSHLNVKQVSTDDPHYLRSITHLRSTIDILDEQIMQLLLQRMNISMDIGRLKKQNNISILQPERLQKMLQDRLESANRLGLDEQFVLRLYQYIHEESIRKQELVESGD